MTKVEHLMETVKYEGVKWDYVLEEKIGSYCITFIAPYKLHSYTKSKDVYKKLKKDPSEVKNKLKSAIEQKRKSKLQDSFNTKFKLFVFEKYFDTNEKEFDKYFNPVNNSIIIEEFKKFEISDELAQVFSSEYYQKDKLETIEYQQSKRTVSAITKKLFDYEGNDNKNSYVFNMTNENYRRSMSEEKIGDLYKQMWESFKESDFNKEYFNHNVFIELLSNSTCAYCGITTEQIKLLGQQGKLNNKRSETRGYSLEIDRKHPNKEYARTNCCMACYWCNNAKTDEYTEEEFKVIAKNINCVWNKRFKQLGSNERVIYPWSDKTEECM